MPDMYEFVVNEKEFVTLINELLGKTTPKVFLSTEKTGIIWGLVGVNLLHGMWRSLVAHLVWDQGVAGSNPAIPTIQEQAHLYCG